MNKTSVDARGRSCPEPVLMTKKAMSDKPVQLEVLVDNPVAVENVSRFAVYSGYTITAVQTGDDYLLTLNMRK